jgi:hypothetical protein
MYYSYRIIRYKEPYNYFYLMKLRILLLLSFAMFVSSQVLLKPDTEELQSNKGSLFTKYSIEVPQDVKTDLVIIASLTSVDFQSSPILYASLDKEINEDRKFESNYVCNQLGSEACIIPKYALESRKNVNIAVECTDCEYSLKYSFVNEHNLSVGEAKKFHLKKGETIDFNVTLPSNEDAVINTFNMREGQYNLSVQNKDLKEAKYEVLTTWKNAKQVKLVSDANKETTYSISIHADSDGFFLVEIFSQKTPISVTEPMFGVEEINNTTKCYSIDFGKKENSNLYAEIKIMFGDDVYYKTNDHSYEKFTGDIVIKLNSNENNVLCLKATDDAVILIQIFSNKTIQLVENRKSALLGK